MKYSLFILLLLTTAIHAQRIDDVVLPVNEFVSISQCCSTPAIKKNVVDTITPTNMINVTAFGAAGNGTTIDNAAITNAFNAFVASPTARGIYFPPNKTYLINNVREYDINKDCIIYAYGATIKMADLGKHSLVAFDYPEYQQTHTFLWLGGTINGNKDFQKWNNNPTGGVYDDTTTEVEAHGRALGVSGAKFALFYKVNFTDIVMDGVAVESCLLGVIAHCTSTRSANIEWKITGQQGTCFKARNYPGTFGRGNTSYFINDVVLDGGSMHVQVSYPQNATMDSTIKTVVVNGTFKNAMQNSLHFEDAGTIIISNTTVEADQDTVYSHLSHFSSKSSYIYLKNCYFRNTEIYASTATAMKLGIATNCRFVSDYSSNATTSLRTFLHNFTHANNCTFDGPTFEEQSQVDFIRKCTFNNFGNEKAAIGVITSDSCTFTNGTVSPISFNTQQNGKAYFSNFSGISNNSNTNSTPANNSYLNDFRSALATYRKHPDGTIKYLTKITAGLN